jgi:hypothetical protein
LGRCSTVRNEASLTPTELVLRWLEEAHAYDDLDAYTHSLFDQPLEAYPASVLAKAAWEGSRARLRGQPREVVDAQVRTALRATLVRFELVLRANVLAHDTIDRESLIRTIIGLRFAMFLDERHHEEDPWACPLVPVDPATGTTSPPSN